MSSARWPLLRRSLDLVLRDIGPEDLAPHFQPIVDLTTSTIVGMEMLTRGPDPHQSPGPLFARARELDLTHELDRACRVAAVARIAAIQHDWPDCHWFLNVSAEVFCDPMQSAAGIADEARFAGIDPSRIVFEVTERDAIADHQRFQSASREYAEEDFLIALDDFGAGSSGMVALLSCTPHIIKLDIELTRGISTHRYKRSIVDSMVRLADSVGAMLIAEGVESWDDLATLAAQGVRFAQGFLLGRPAPVPARLSLPTLDALHRFARNGIVPVERPV